MGIILIKRVYEPPDESDGYRVLVDRLWPRGLSREKLHADEWIKYIAPSADIRKAFGHREENFDTFKAAYLAELNGNPHKDDFIKLAKDRLIIGNLTLLYAASNETINHAVVLRDWLTFML